MKTLRERNDISDEMKWDLDPLYQSASEWDHDFEKINGLMAEVQKFRGRLHESPAILLDAFNAMDALERIIEKLHTFAHLKSDEDTGNSENLSRLEKIVSKSSEADGEIAWFEDEIISFSEDYTAELLQSQELESRRFEIEEILRDKPHILSEPEERILGLASEIFSAPHGIFSVLNDADMKFPSIKDENGEDVELTHGNYSRFIESENREIRKAAFRTMHGKYLEFRNTFATILDSTVKANVLEAELRKFPCPVSAALWDENIPLDVYKNIVFSVRKRAGILHEYFRVRKKILGLDVLEHYDLRNPLVPRSDEKITWKQACEDVSEALLPLGDKCSEMLREAFSKRWLDYVENKGKRSGAYSSGCYDSPSYILMNFNGALDDVFTLAHELGHSLNSWLTNRTQPYHDSDISIFLSEIASNVCELLLHEHYARKADSPEARLRLANHFADEFRGAVFRQAMFSEFEQEIYRLRFEGEPLSADCLSDIYYSINRRYHGEHVSEDRIIDIEWARIPHFHYNFYVFKYVSGFASAIKIVEKLGKDDAFLEKYLRFLSAGSSAPPMKILNELGIFPERADFFDDAFAKFNSILKEIEKFSNE